MSLQTAGVVGIVGTVLTTCVGYDLIDNNKVRGTTVAGFVSAMVTTIAVPERDAKTTEAYLDSLTDEQLVELEQKLEAREANMSSENTIENQVHVK